MNKQDLINELAVQTESSKVATGRLVDALLDTLQETLSRGEKVKIAGFGTFERISVRGRLGRNPKTGQRFDIAPTTRPRFTPSLILRDKTRIAP